MIPPPPTPPPTRLGLITVTVVDGNDVFRAHLCRTLSRCPGIVVFDQCASLADAEACLTQRPPRVLLVGDTGRGNADWEMLVALRSPRSNLLTLALSDSAELEHVRAAFRAGAVGYLLRNSAAHLIQRALHEVMTGGAPMTPEIARVLVTSYSAPARPSGLLLTLTRREREILDLLSLGTRYREIATQLSLSRDTVHSHTKKIYRKLMVKSKTEAALVLGRAGQPLHLLDSPARAVA